MVDKILFVGMGSIGCRHLKNIKKLLPSVKIAALRSNKKSISNQYDDLIDHEFYDIEDAREFKPDIVFITNPTSMHVETALKFIDQVNWMFIEKPVSDSTQKVQKLIDQNKNTFIHVACPLRFHPVLQYIKSYLEDSAKIINIKIVSGSYLPDWRPEQDYRETYCAKNELGGGVSLDLIHEIDYMRWIFGDVYQGYFGSAKISELEIETEDVSYGIWKLKNGILCEIHLDYFRKIPQRYMEIVTKEAVITVDLINSVITIDDGKNTERIEIDFDRNDMYITEIQYFLGIINNGEKSFNDLHFAMDTLKYAIYMRDNTGVVNL